MNFLQPAKLYESDYCSGEDKTVAVTENAVEKVEPLNMPIKIGNINTTLLVGSGSACSILNRSLASQVVQSSPCAFWISEQMPPQLRTFSNEPIQVEGKIQASITSNGWTCDSATFTVVADGLITLTGRDLFRQGRRIPVNLQEKVNTELKKLLDEKHIVKLSSCADK